MARESVSRYYCTDIPGLVSCLGDSIREGERFPDIELLETNDATVYFDSREGFDASPIQTYLELLSGEKRERETAQQVRKRLLKDMGEAKGNA
jgi:hypothetical protein